MSAPRPCPVASFAATSGAAPAATSQGCNAVQATNRLPRRPAATRRAFRTASDGSTFWSRSRCTERCEQYGLRQSREAHASPSLSHGNPPRLLVPISHGQVGRWLGQGHLEEGGSPNLQVPTRPELWRSPTWLDRLLGRPVGRTRRVPSRGRSVQNLPAPTHPARPSRRRLRARSLGRATRVQRPVPALPRQIHRCTAGRERPHGYPSHGFRPFHGDRSLLSAGG